MGMSFSDTKNEYAAILQDAEYAVEFGLYPLPTSLETLQKTVTQLQALPHTPEETGKIAVRLWAAANGQEWADEAALQNLEALFGESDRDVVEAAAIPLTKENYGLVYSAVQLALDQMGTSLPETQQTAVETLTSEALTEALQRQLETTVQQLTAAFRERSTDIVLSVEEQETLAARVAEKLRDQTAVDERVTTLQARLTEAEEENHLALTSLVGFYMTQLRKPLARGKSREEVIVALQARTRESLKDTLQDLQSEADAGGNTPPPTTKIEDPTKPGSQVEDDTTDPVVKDPTSEKSLTSLQQVTALELDDEDSEPDILTILFPDF